MTESDTLSHTLTIEKHQLTFKLLQRFFIQKLVGWESICFSDTSRHAGVFKPKDGEKKLSDGHSNF